MPNHVENHIEFNGDKQQIDAMINKIKSDKYGIGTIDFKKIIPMPETLNIEAGSKTDHGLKAYREFIEAYTAGRSYKEALKALENIPTESENAFLRQRTDIKRDEWELGKTAWQNIQKYGAPTWYEWSINNWGTKWNAYGYEEGTDYSACDELTFQTAWSAPHPILRKLSEMFPEIVFKHQWADEDIGMNCGERCYLGGNALYVSSNTGVYNAVSVKSSGRYTYKEIIQNGYGCSVLTVKNVITIKTEYTNTIAHWKYVGTGGDNGNGTFKKMGTSTFTGKAGNSVTIPSNLVQSYTGYYNTGVAGSYWGTGTWSSKDIGSTFIQPESSLWIEYYYYPNTYTNSISHWAWGFNGNGNNGDRNAFHLTNTTFTKNYGDVFALTEADATAIPNGFYLNNTWQIGTSSVDGTWKNYPYGTKFTQKSYNMGFEYDYHPYTYNITYDLDGGTNDPNNPTSYNVLYGKTLNDPTKPDYDFLGWMRVDTIPKIALPALSTNYMYQDLINDVEAGTNFEIKIGNAKTTAGSASLFSCVIYDFTDSKCLLQKNVLFGSNISFSVDCPSDADSNHDIRLLFYSGIAGYTKGIATEFTDIQISFFVDGINKGCGSAFGSPNELYTELSKRTTGDIKLIAKWESYEKIAIVPIEPNAPYREKTNVISSFWLVNLSDDDYTPTTGAKVVFSVYNSSGQRIADETQGFVAPKKDKNLAYFGWYVPDGYAAADVTVKAYIDDGPYQYSHTSESFTIASYDTCIEPDTDYNAKAPDGFTVPPSPSDSTTSGRWWQWVYSGGAYTKKQFAVANTVNELVLTAPTSPSAYTENGKLYIKSGYGFELSFKDSMYTVSGYTDGSVNECFAPQYYYALFPEYNYTYGRDKCRSIETVSGKKVFVNAADMARQHFTPIYYPDGEYKLKAVLSDCWTPAGMITTYKTVAVQINGNVYDDHYVGRQE